MRGFKTNHVVSAAAGICLLLAILCLAAPAPLMAGTAPGSVSIEQKGRAVSIRADGAPVSSVLKALEDKTGIRFVVHDAVPDRPVSFTIESLHLAPLPQGIKSTESALQGALLPGSIDAVLEQMGLRNTVTSQDGKTGRTVVHVLPEGKADSDFVREPSVIRIGQAAAATPATQTLTVKGKEVVAEALPETSLAVRYIRDEVMLRFQPETSAAEIGDVLDRHGLSMITAPGDPLLRLGFVKAAIPGQRNLRELIGQLAREPGLQSLEPNYVANLFQAPDPLYPLQWYITGMGFDRFRKRVKDVPEITVAVVDTGVDGRHPDLQGKILPGYDFVHGSHDTGDPLGHGSFVAGIIAASSGNGIGIRGLIEKARIIPVKVLDERGWGTYEDVARGIVFAADRGARVINLSLGGYGSSWLLNAAVEYAIGKGCVVVAAGGNDGVTRAVYPAACPGVIGVGALAPDGKPWSKSNRGGNIDIFAPGVDIVSTGPDGGYVRATGTSGAAPMVSALTAYLLQERTDQSAKGILQAIRQVMKDRSGGGD